MTYAGPGDDGLQFTSPGGAPLRHTGNTLSANTGANLREQMDRMGRASPRAAFIYLHGSDERQQAIAAVLSRRAAAELNAARLEPSGTRNRSSARQASGNENSAARR